jgi:hypothetical protein
MVRKKGEELLSNEEPNSNEDYIRNLLKDFQQRGNPNVPMVEEEGLCKTEKS